MTGPDGKLYYSESGGYYNGPLKRITRTTSFTPSSVSTQPLLVHAGEVITYLLHVSHAGTLSNTFALTATLSPSVALESAGSGLTFDANHVYWSGLLKGIQTTTGTFAVHVTDPTTTPYFLTTPIEIDAPTLPPVFLPATVLVNPDVLFLPIVRK